MILVACGLKREAAIIARAGVRVIAGGGDLARLEAELAAATAGATAVLSCGIAGALAPGLKAGDVAIGDLHPDTPSATFPGQGQDLAAQGPLLDPCLHRGSNLLEWLQQHLPYAHRGTIIGTDRIIGSVAEKTGLYGRTGAIAVDMESHIAARIAAGHGLPFAILRTISDTADHALPPAALVGMRPDGGIALGAVFASLARNPGQLPALIRTGRDTEAAFRALGRAIGAVIN